MVFLRTAEPRDSSSLVGLLIARSQVNHYADLSRGALDYKFNYELPNGSLYTGLSPPANAVPKGLLYPRSAAIGGCVNHNALILFYPLDDDWTAIVNLTGDSSWNATGMRRYFERLEDCQYLPKGTPGHGFGGWLQTNRADPSIFLSDNKTYPLLKVYSHLSLVRMKDFLLARVLGCSGSDGTSHHFSL